MTPPMRGVLIVAFLYATSLALAQTTPAPAGPPDTFDLWLQGRIDSAVNKARIGINGKSTTRQIQSPSANDRSTSLVDHSSATDFVSTALNLVPVSGANTSGTSSGAAAGSTGTNSAGASTGSGTVTATLYSLLAGFNHTSLTDPHFYAAHTPSRQVSFTAGTAQSSPTTDNSTKPGAVVGIKVTPVNGRDLYSRNGQDAVAGVQKALTKAAVAYRPLATRVRNLIFLACQPEGNCRSGKLDGLDISDPAVQAFATFWGKYQTNMRGLRLSQDNLDRIDELIQGSLAAFTDYQTIVEKSYDRIHQGQQLALAYTGVIRTGTGYNDHRAELVFDYGLSDEITWTINGSGDYIDRKSTKASRGGTVSMEFLGRLTHESTDPNGPRSIMLSFSGQAKWLTMIKPQYTCQGALTIPLASGVEIPIGFRWVNRKALLDQSSTELHVGLSIDAGRVAQLFK